jgi:hypothetical protein
MGGPSQRPLPSKRPWGESVQNRTGTLRKWQAGGCPNHRLRQVVADHRRR